jgi:hypothetical protein
MARVKSREEACNRGSLGQLPEKGPIDMLSSEPASVCTAAWGCTSPTALADLPWGYRAREPRAWLTCIAGLVRLDIIQSLFSLPET